MLGSMYLRKMPCGGQHEINGTVWFHGFSRGQRQKTRWDFVTDTSPDSLQERACIYSIHPKTSTVSHTGTRRDPVCWTNPLLIYKDACWTWSPLATLPVSSPFDWSGLSSNTYNTNTDDLFVILRESVLYFHCSSKNQIGSWIVSNPKQSSGPFLGVDLRVLLPFSSLSTLSTLWRKAIGTWNALRNEPRFTQTPSFFLQKRKAQLRLWICNIWLYTHNV